MLVAREWFSFQLVNPSRHLSAYNLFPTESSWTIPFVMAPTLPQLSFGRMRSYIYRLPLFTRLIVSLIIILWIISISLGSVWDIQQLCSLIPDEMNMGTRKFRASLDLIKSNWLDRKQSIARIHFLLCMQDSCMPFSTFLPSPHCWNDLRPNMEPSHPLLCFLDVSAISRFLHNSSKTNLQHYLRYPQSCTHSLKGVY